MINEKVIRNWIIVIAISFVVFKTSHALAQSPKAFVSGVITPDHLTIRYDFEYGKTYRVHIESLDGSLTFLPVVGKGKMETKLIPNNTDSDFYRAVIISEDGQIAWQTNLIPAAKGVDDDCDDETETK